MILPSMPAPMRRPVRLTCRVMPASSATGVYRTALGRPKGETNTSKLDEHAPMFRQLAAAGASDAMLARLFKVSRQTIKRFRAIEKRRTTSSTNQQETPQ